MAYRMYRRDPVDKGSWYHSVRCKACGEMVYVLDDRSNGTKPIKMAGDDELLISCNKCLHDDTYLVGDVEVAQATEDRPSEKPDRVAVSKSSRKPLLKSFPKSNPVMGVGYIGDRPEAAAIVGRIVTSWADVEVQSARLLSELMGTNIPAAAAVFGSLRSSRAQHDAISAAASVTLNEPDLELFEAHMNRRSSLEKERNDLAHGCYGVIVGVRDHVAWASQGDFLRFTTSARSGEPIPAEEFRKKIFVYEFGTLERIAQEIEEFYHQLGFFSGYLVARSGGSDGEVFRAQQYSQLCSQPHIRQALDRARTAKKAARAAAPIPRGEKKPKR